MEILNLLPQTLIMGIAATVAIDLWLAVLSLGFSLPTTNWAMVGRWLGHLPSGKFIHKPIGSSTEINNERIIGWALHYAIGIAYAFLYLMIVVFFIEGEPSLLSALLFGLTTVIVPWFVLQPGMGLGMMARRTPKPNLSRLMSLSVHAIFGVSLYIGWLISLNFV